MLKNPDCLAPTPDNLFYPPKKGDYVYFESPRYTAGASVLVDAAWAADAAMLAYARYGSTRMNSDEYSVILSRAGFTTINTIGDCFVDNACTARGFFAANDVYALLAFRGTEKGNDYDLVADADAVMVADDGARVDQGFRRYLHTVWWRVAELVRAYRQNHPRQDICVTGHSLGAALASLAFTYLRDPATSLYTFGCPRVGDPAFCARIMDAAQAQRCYRIVDNQDLVTHVPLDTVQFPYQHPNVTVLWINPDGKLITNPPQPPDDWKAFARLGLGTLEGHWLNFLPAPLPRPLADHSPVRYCYWIAQAL